MIKTFQINKFLFQSKFQFSNCQPETWKLLQISVRLLEIEPKVNLGDEYLASPPFKDFFEAVNWASETSDITTFKHKNHLVDKKYKKLCSIIRFYAPAAQQ